MRAARSSETSGERVQMMGIAQIYREAARAVERGETYDKHSACWALAWVLNRDNPKFGSYPLPEMPNPVQPFCGALKEVFAPHSHGDYWLNAEDRDDNGPRILALCFMAAMVESGDIAIEVRADRSPAK